MQSKGFTLIEILVSTALFTIVVTMALGALLSLSSADRRAESLKSAIDNLTFATDSMSRTIRTGSIYHCGTSGVVSAPQDCWGTGANYFAFTAAGGTKVAYQLDTSTAVCNQTGTIGCLERNISTDGGVTWSGWLPITSPDIVIQNTGFLFHSVGGAAGDGFQPKVIITVTGTVNISASQTSAFHLETSVTQRIYDQ